MRLREERRVARASGSARVGRKLVLVIALVSIACLLAPQVAAAHRNSDDSAYEVTPLVSSNGVPNTVVDPNLLNAWGLDAGPATPWWVADNHADLSTLYNAAGAKLGLEVTVTGGPTGLVFNGGSGFPVGPSNVSARFIFSTEAGTINGWTPTAGTVAEIKVDASGSGAIYKGLAIATTTAGPMLYATDFANARVDAFDGGWAPVTTEGGFVDEKIPAGYAPFGIQTIGSRIFVTYAKQGPTGDELHGKGFGFVDAYDTAGHLLSRVARHGTLNAPWGLAMAPENFGRFGGDLLVGKDRKSTRLNSSHQIISYAVFCLKKKIIHRPRWPATTPIRLPRRRAKYFSSCTTSPTARGSSHARHSPTDDISSSSTAETRNIAI